LDRITFDFETGEIIFNTDAQQGCEVDPHLKDKREAIMTAAGYDTFSTSKFFSDLSAIFREYGINATYPNDKGE
jgi:hypothetical protein